MINNNETEPINKIPKQERNKTKLNLDGFNSNEIKKYEMTQEEFLVIAEQAKNNPIVLNWMNDVFENNMNFESAINFLFSLDLNEKTKEFMFNGLYDKMSIVESQAISNAEAFKVRNQVKSAYVQVNGMRVHNADGNFIRNKGISRTTPEIQDNLWKDDVSYIRYNTQDVYNVYTKGLDKSFVRRLESSIRRINGSKYALDFAIRNIHFFLPDQFEILDPIIK
ncbi:MAG: hypothetical protein ACRCWU_00955 [Metamycoplasmataceae bacterium]